MSRQDDMMNPRRAQEQTERKWDCLSNKETANYAPYCGWCKFANVVGGAGGACFRDFCPVVRVFDTTCFKIPEFCDWDLMVGTCSATTEAAQVIYDLVVANRDALIKAGEEILREQDYG